MSPATLRCALANGQSERWVADRTDHKSSSQINGYRRKARTARRCRAGTGRAAIAADVMVEHAKEHAKADIANAEYERAHRARGMRLMSITFTANVVGSGWIAVVALLASRQSRMMLVTL